MRWTGAPAGVTTKTRCTAWLPGARGRLCGSPPGWRPKRGAPLACSGRRTCRVMLPMDFFQSLRDTRSSKGRRACRVMLPMEQTDVAALAFRAMPLPRGADPINRSCRFICRICYHFPFGVDQNARIREKYIRYAPLPWGWSPRLWNAKPACAGYGGLFTQRA